MPEGSLFNSLGLIQPMVAPLVEAATSDLETVTADLIKRKYTAREGSAERQLIVRELSGLRYSYKNPIIEDLDPLAGGTCRPLPVTVQPIQPRRK